MGSDDLFHKRKARAAKSLKRKVDKRSSYDRVLIVCEGEKTEPNYFEELVSFYKLNTANVAIDGSCGSSPRSVLERAVELWNKEKKKGDPYDRVYCVFDKDTHPTYNEALERIRDRNSQNKEVFFAAHSVPCFEYWLILHFHYTTKPYAASGKSSIADTVVHDLKDLMPNYEKGDRNTFIQLSEQLEFAKTNAARSLKYAQDRHTDNPSTHIHELVEYLQNLASEIKLT